MRNYFSFSTGLLAVSLISFGCATAGPERKLGRGINNITELARGGEIRRSMEQTAFAGSSPEVAYTTGFIHGVNRSLARTFVGVYEVLTFPFPDHGRNDFSPVFTPENPVYPESYKPNIISETFFSPDSALGFGGGDIAPFIPGSRFRIFDN
ncbi:MAG: exosortase system-associated protein, TIGR04073 family [Verrucomicrobiota bacterium]|nr:exosortase system-associated protein, TIGR04073 family [Verrucomicrobiota bacterium]